MNRKIAVVGLGYVGLPVAIAFGKKSKVIGFDINNRRISELKNNYDRTNEVCENDLKKADIHFTNDKDVLKEADFYIVAVPTPIDNNNYPDLRAIEGACLEVSSTLKKNDIVVFESTVYPGLTEEVCIPLLEKYTELVCGKDFFIGYSPERINPGDKIHTFESIVKVVSGQNDQVLDIVSEVYSSVVKAGVYKATSIKVAEAAKIIENTQRDVNIALMNELSLIFDRAGINTIDVLKTAGTKWNFLDFKPGLVGGHCIGVDPYYLSYKAQELGFHSELILASRRINDNMSQYIASSVVKHVLKKGIDINKTKVTVLGLTFKENCPDLRNTKVIDVIKELKEYGFKIQVNDVYADKEEAMDLYNIDLKTIDEIEETSIMILAVPHQEYILDKSSILAKLSKDGMVFDIKSVLEESDLAEGQSLWRL